MLAIQLVHVYILHVYDLYIYGALLGLDKQSLDQDGESLRIFVQRRSREKEINRKDDSMFFFFNIIVGGELLIQCFFKFTVEPR